MMNATSDPTPDTAGAARPVGGPSVLRVLGLAVGLATVVGLVAVVLLRVSTTMIGRPVPWAEAAGGWLDWYVWAALTPLVVWLARAVPVRPDRWRRAVSLHVVLGGAVALIELGLYAVSRSVYTELFLDLTLQPFADRYIFLVGRWLPIQMLIYALIVAVVSAIDILSELRAREVRAAQLETELSRAQVHALQTQIQPHFLFNVMNGVSMAVREGRSDRAVAMMSHLGGILRRSISATVEPETSLGSELDFVRDYLELESCRMEERLSVEWDVAAELRSVRVPSMILQPLVENAIRHGLAPAPDGGTLVIRVQEAGDHVRMSIEDDGVGLPPGPGRADGTGLGNVRKRLATLYDGAAELRVVPLPGGGTTASITLPRRSDEP